MPTEDTTGRSKPIAAGQNRMRAVLHRIYGGPDVLSVEDVEKPAPGPEEVLVRVRAASVNPHDWHRMIGLPVGRAQIGLLRPRNERLGIDYAGVIEAKGERVRDFDVGDEVYRSEDGAFAEYVCAQAGFAPKPKALSFEEAAAIPVAALTALQGLRDHGKIGPGQKVLINGASGGVGTFAVQIAKAFGAQVTGVCSTRNVGQTRALGTDEVIDYTREDFSLTGERYDLFLDVAGSRPWEDCRRVLKAHARVVIVGGPRNNRWLGPLSHVLRMRLASLGSSPSVLFFITRRIPGDLQMLNDLIDKGKLRPVIDRSYVLDDISQAMAYLGEGHARGKVVLSIPG